MRVRTLLHRTSCNPIVRPGARMSAQPRTMAPLSQPMRIAKYHDEHALDGGYAPATVTVWIRPTGARTRSRSRARRPRSLAVGDRVPGGGAVGGDVHRQGWSRASTRTAGRGRTSSRARGRAGRSRSTSCAPTSNGSPGNPARTWRPISGRLYGPEGPAIVERDRSRCKDWLVERFPAGAAGVPDRVNGADVSTATVAPVRSPYGSASSTGEPPHGRTGWREHR